MIKKIKQNSYSNLVDAKSHTRARNNHSMVPELIRTILFYTPNVY